MSDESTFVVALVAVVVAMIVGIVASQKRSARRLASQRTISLPIDSVGRTVAVVLPAAIVVPVLVGIVAELTDPWLRGHAAGVVLGMVIGSGASIVGAVWATKRFRQIGALTLADDALELRIGGVVNQIDLARPWDHFEGWSTGPQGMQLQVAIVTQDGRSWGFSYGLTVYQKPYGDPVSVDTRSAPSLSSDARVVHDRLRGQRATAAALLRIEPSVTQVV